MRFKNILFTLCLVTAAVLAKGQGISLSPSRLFFSGNPGETVTQTITFNNSSGNVLSFITKVQDWKRDSLGKKIYFDSNTQPLSNASWITLSSNTVTIQPGENKKVIVSLTIPANATKQSNSMLFFTQVAAQNPQKISGTSLGVNVLLEMGVQVYYTPKGLNQGEIKYLNFEDRGEQLENAVKSRRLAIKIHNTGAVNKDAFMRLELTNKETGEEIKVDPQTIAMLPDATSWIIFDLPADLKGKFLAVALLDAGPSSDLKVAEKEIIYRP